MVVKWGNSDIILSMNIEFDLPSKKSLLIDKKMLVTIGKLVSDDFFTVPEALAAMGIPPSYFAFWRGLAETDENARIIVTYLEMAEGRRSAKLAKDVAFSNDNKAKVALLQRFDALKKEEDERYRATGSDLSVLGISPDDEWIEG